MKTERKDKRGHYFAYQLKVLWKLLTESDGFVVLVETEDRIVNLLRRGNSFSFITYRALRIHSAFSFANLIANLQPKVSHRQ